MEAAKLRLRKKTKIQRNKVKKKKKRERKEPILMCELETGLIITPGLLSSPTHSVASL